MKRFYLLSLMLALLMALTPLAALAQDDMEWETYSTEDELFSVDYPADWLLSEAGAEGIPFPAVVIVNSEEALAHFEAENGQQEAGDQAISTLLMPGDFLAFMGVTLEEDTSIADITTMLVEFFLAPEEDATEEEIAATQIGEVEEIELSEDVIAGYALITEIDSEGGFLVTEPVEGVFAISLIAAFPGEYSDELAEIGMQVAASISYEGTAEDLMLAIMGGPPAGEGDDGMGAADLDGEALVAERCTVCHTADRIDTADKDEVGWTATVDRMIGYGTDLNDAEREAVIAYLAEM